MNGDWEEFLVEAQEVLDLLDEIKGAGTDYANSVSSQLEGVMEWVEEHEHVTERQEAALANWREGAEKWL